MKIGKYEILEKLGEGGMGVVYKAFDANMERDVAIKVLSAQLFAKPDVKKRFFQEARFAGKLSHENITIVFELGELEGKPYIVMEYLTGKDLAKIITQKEPVTLNEKLDYALQICKGLEYSHSYYIIHRDIKPANIKILDGGRVKIMDFGLAKPLESDLTRDAVMMGTTHYMSPEQIQDELIDNRSEIFSFGALFYELLSFKRPFEGDDPNSIMYKIVHEKPAPIDDTKVENVLRIKNIVSKCLEKNTDERYQSFTEIIENLDEILRDRRSKEKQEIDEKRKNFETLVSAAENQLKEKNLRTASASVNMAAEIEPRNTQVLALINRIETELEIEKTYEFIRERLKEARELQKTKQYEKTVQTIEEILKIEPNHAEGLKIVEEAIDQSRLEEEEDRKKKDIEEVLMLSPEHGQAKTLHKKATEAVNQKLYVVDKVSLAEEEEQVDFNDIVIPVTVENIDKTNSSNGQKNRKFLLIGAISLLSAILIAVILMFIVPQFKETAENNLAITLAAQEQLEAENAQLKMLLMKEKADGLASMSNAERSYELAERKGTQGDNAFEQQNYRDAKVAFEMAIGFYELAAETAKKNIETRDRLNAERKVLSAKERLTLAVRDSMVEMRMIASLAPASAYASEDFEAAMAKLERGNNSYRTKNYKSAVNYFREAREYFEKAQETAFRADSLMREIDKIKPEILQSKNDIYSKLNTVVMDSLLNISYQKVMNSESRADGLYVLGNFDSALPQYRLTQEMYGRTMRLLDEQIKREREKESKEFIAQSEPPQPIGGLAEISKNLKYPKSALWAATEGKVIVRALVDVDGRVVDTEILKSLTPQCDKAAVAAIKSVSWKPAIQQGKPVKLWCTIPITFKIK